MQVVQEVLAGVATLVGFTILLAMIAIVVWRVRKKPSIATMLKRHFSPNSLERIAVTERQFPAHIRADIHGAIDSFTQGVTVSSLHGVQSQYPGLGGVDFVSLLHESLIDMAGSSIAGPPQYEQIDVGEEEPIQTVKNGMWLLRNDVTKFAVLFAANSEMGECAVSERIRLQIAAVDDERGRTIAREFLKHVEAEIANARSYRGKVLSLEQVDSYSGQSAGVKVHQLNKVNRDEVILPQRTLDLLDRNVIEFVDRRENLREFQMSTKKGLLFYGPPGTGKTHTIRYLAGSLEVHTTLLVSADQVALLSEYMTLARLLQPSIVAIEDVDLIARERSRMKHPGTELVLNKLLNEMDGLREDCDILFILTTNRPEELEMALASRPGRIDQAIEFPLPDDEGRAKLVRLYSRGIVVGDELVSAIVRRTENVSASFIKELMRRSAQFQLERNGAQSLSVADVEGALQEMLFSGGSLNLKLLGAENLKTGQPPA